MSSIDKVRVNNTDYDIVSGDNLPVGTEVDIDDNTTIPTGWEEVEDKGEIYSTTEQRIGTWIDGKPIYRKTIVKTQFPANSSQTYTLSSLGLDNADLIIMDFSGSTSRWFRTNVATPGYMPISYYVGNSDFTHCYINTSNQLNIWNGSSFIRDFYITVKYTKTTDTVS